MLIEQIVELQLRGPGPSGLTCRAGVEDTRLKAKDTKKFRGQGQGQTLSRPRPRTKDADASVLQKQKKVFQNFFFRQFQKKGLQKFFSGDLYLRKLKRKSLQIFQKVSGVFQRNFNGSKRVLSLSQGQGNFRGLDASRPRPRTLKFVLEAKDLLEDSTSANMHFYNWLFS